MQRGSRIQHRGERELEPRLLARVVFLAVAVALSGGFLSARAPRSFDRPGGTATFKFNRRRGRRPAHADADGQASATAALAPAPAVAPFSRPVRARSLPLPLAPAPAPPSLPLSRLGCGCGRGRAGEHAREGVRGPHADEPRVGTSKQRTSRRAPRASGAHLRCVDMRNVPVGAASTRVCRGWIVRGARYLRTARPGGHGHGHGHRPKATGERCSATLFCRESRGGTLHPRTG